MIIKKAPKIYKVGDLRTKVRFAFVPVQLNVKKQIDRGTGKIIDIIGETIWLEKYIITYTYSLNKKWEFKKSERYSKAFLDKLCE